MNKIIKIFMFGVFFASGAQAMEYPQAQRLKLGMALLQAANAGYFEKVKPLIDAGADVTYAGAHGDTALQYMIMKKNEECVELLIDAGADCNRGDYSRSQIPLILAAQKGWLYGIRRLLQGGADVNQKGDGDRTALRWAAENGYMDCVRELIDAGASTDRATDRAIKELQDERPELAEELINAARFGKWLEVAKLIQGGAFVDRKDKVSGCTALLLTACSGNQQCMALLINAGADVNYINCSDTPLSAAVHYGYTSCVRLLIDAGANVNYSNGGLFAPLVQAAQKGSIDCVRLLIDAGAKLSYSALTAAAGPCNSRWWSESHKRNHLTICELIVEKMLSIYRKEITLFLGVCKKQNFNGQYHNLHDLFSSMFAAILQENRSQVRAQINKLEDPIKQYLLDKYFPK